MKTILVAVALATFSAPTVAIAHTEATNANRSEAEARLRSIILEQYPHMLAAKDVEGILDLFATDAVLIRSGKPIARGRDAIAADWTKFVNLPGLVSRCDPNITVAAAGDVGYEWGTCVHSYLGADGQRVTSSGKFTAVWRQIDGEWKAVVDTWVND